MIFGLCGFKGSGKNTAAMFFNNYIQDSFAAPVKDVASVVFGWDRKWLEGDTNESRTWREEPDLFWSDVLEKSFSPRDGLTLIGTETFRNVVHKNIWIKSLENRIKNQPNVVITDCRFINEIQFIRDIGGKIIWIKKNTPSWFDDALEYHKTGFISKELSKNHISEYEWLHFYNNFDYVVENNKDLSHLKSEINLLLKNYQG